MFCNASIAANDDQRQKLEKLLKLWESKANYLKADTLEKMRHPLQSYQQYQSDQMAKYATEVAALAQQTKITFDGYQAQHQAFVCHAMQQIMDLQQQKQNLEQQQQPPQQPPQPPIVSNATNIIPLETIQASLQQTIQNLSQNVSVPPSQSSAHTFPMQHINPPNPNDNFVPMNTSIPPPTMSQQPTAALQPSPVVNQLPNNINQHTNNIGPHPSEIHQLTNLNPPPSFTSPPDLSQQPPQIVQPSNGIENIPFSQPPPGYFPPPGMFPDFSKPPPGFPSKAEPFLEELMPTAPYYDLPAGLIVPLIKVCGL